MKTNWNFLRGGGCKTKNLLWGEYGIMAYFLELHNNEVQVSKRSAPTVLWSMNNTV